MAHTPDILRRYTLLIQRLRQRPSTARELLRYLADYMPQEAMPAAYDTRQLRRDLEAIRLYFGMDFRPVRPELRYTLVADETPPETSTALAQALEIWHACSAGQALAPYIQRERQVQAGTQWLLPLLRAIAARQRVRFVHQKYNDPAPSTREADPWLLKEHRGRWYLLARDRRDDRVKTFGLDRITGLDVQQGHFRPPEAGAAEFLFAHCFGIIPGEPGHPPQTVRLWVAQQQVPYICSHPLHSSQSVESEDDEGITLRLSVYNTYDLRMELMSHGANIRVLEPQELVDDMKAEVRDMMTLYGK